MPWERELHEGEGLNERLFPLCADRDFGDAGSPVSLPTRCGFTHEIQARCASRGLENHDRLFLSQRGKPYTYEAFKPHWYRLCAAVGLDLGIHALRHWYTTQAMRVIAETAKTSAELELRKEELVRYMAWRSADTLRAYEHYFKGVQHYCIQDQVHQRLAEDVVAYTQTKEKQAPRDMPIKQTPKPASVQEQRDGDGWATLLTLGGAQ